MKLLCKIFSFPFIILGTAVALLLVISGWSSYLYTPAMPALSLTGMAFPAILIANLLFALFWGIFRNRAIWIQLAAIILTITPILQYSPLHAFHPSAGGPDNSIRLLSYNVHFFEDINGDQPYDLTNPIINYLSNSDADIICLQEPNIPILQRQFKNKDFLPEMKYMYPSRGTNIAVMSRWPILEWKEIHFPESRNRSLYCRILRGTDTIAVYNCHFQSFELKQNEIDDYHNFIEHPKDTVSYHGMASAIRKLSKAAVKRAGQVQAIDSMLDCETARYIILCGDFNDTPLSYAHRIISGKLTDAYVKTGFGPGISYNLNRLYFRIDHVFCNGNLIPVRCKVDKSISSSDHYPVNCVFNLR